MATFLHSRRFLGYHGARFTDRSLLFRDERSRLLGVFPAAVDPADESRVVSHPGLTYGGVVHAGGLAGARMVSAIASIRDHYAEQGFSALRYKVVPAIYHRRPATDDVYALVRNGAVLYRCDLSCALDLGERGRRSERRQRGQRKAERLGVKVLFGAEHLDELWRVLEENLAQRHSLRPTHTVDEMRLLLSLVPEAIEVVTAHLDDSVVAGVVLFRTARVVHAQYVASDRRGRESAALDLLMERCIEQAEAAGARFFDFGISTEDEGRVLNAGLHRFKSEFGGGGVVHEFYELDLTR